MNCFEQNLSGGDWGRLSKIVHSANFAEGHSARVTKTGIAGQDFVKDSVLLDLHQNCGAESSASWNTNGGPNTINMKTNTALCNFITSPYQSCSAALRFFPRACDRQHVPP
jgi:hypothetical protein